MTMEKNIIFSDLDGTLLDHFTYQSTAANDTLKQLKTVNIPVILNTSKTFAELETIHQDLKLECPFIIENGAAVYIPIGTFVKRPADTVVVGGYWVKSFTLPIQHWLSLLAEEAKEFRPFFKGFSELSSELLSQITGLSVEEAKQAKQRGYGEPIQWLSDNATKARFIKHMNKLGANVVEGGRFLHVSGYCDKGQALQWLTKQYKEDYQNHFDDNSVSTIALGDGENDIAMLEVADFAVQVKSPVHKFPVLARKNKVTKTQLYGPEGWVEAIQYILAKQLIAH